MEIGAILPVGTIIHSMLSTAQFATQYGDNWVLADGRSVSGSLYHTVTGSSTIPDLRGRFLRAKSHASGNNPDGDLALGTYSADKYLAHAHSTNGNDNPANATGSTFAFGQATVTGTVATNTSGGNETAPRSITVNVFIRIN